MTKGAQLLIVLALGIWLPFPLEFGSRGAQAQANAGVKVTGAVVDGKGKKIMPSIVLSILDTQTNVPVTCDRDGKFEHELKGQLPQEIMLQFFYTGVPVRTIRFLSGKMSQNLNVVIYTNQQLRKVSPRVALLELNDLQGYFLFETTATIETQEFFQRYRRGIRERVEILEEVLGEKNLPPQLRDAVHQSVRALKSFSPK